MNRRKFIKKEGNEAKMSQYLQYFGIVLSNTDLRHGNNACHQLQSYLNYIFAFYFQAILH